MRRVNSSRAAEAFRHLGNDLIVTVQHNRVAGGLDPLHRLNQQIASDPAHDVLGPGAAISALAVPAIR